MTDWWEWVLKYLQNCQVCSSAKAVCTPWKLDHCTGFKSTRLCQEFCDHSQIFLSHTDHQYYFVLQCHTDNFSDLQPQKSVHVVKLPVMKCIRSILSKTEERSTVHENAALGSLLCFSFCFWT